MKFLYICTHNRCRSIMSEAITNHLGQGRLVAKSAGSQPSGEVHALSLKFLAEAGIPTKDLVSQSWHELENFAPDVVITVCDAAARETCPVWFGSSLKVHWGLQDPSKLIGTDAEVADAFRATIAEITERVQQLIAMNIDVTDNSGLGAQLAALGAK